MFRLKNIIISIHLDAMLRPYFADGCITVGLGNDHCKLSVMYFDDVLLRIAWEKLHPRDSGKIAYLL